MVQTFEHELVTVTAAEEPAQRRALAVVGGVLVTGQHDRPGCPPGGVGGQVAEDTDRSLSSLLCK